MHRSAAAGQAAPNPKLGLAPPPVALYFARGARWEALWNSFATRPKLGGFRPPPSSSRQTWLHAKRAYLAAQVRNAQVRHLAQSAVRRPRANAFLGCPDAILKRWRKALGGVPPVRHLCVSQGGAGGHAWPAPRVAAPMMQPNGHGTHPWHLEMLQPPKPKP